MGIGYERAENFMSPGGLDKDASHGYSIPKHLELNQWGFAGTWKDGGQVASLEAAGGKIVYAWAVEGDIDASAIRSNTFSLEWPPRSKKIQEFPEVDRGGWFDLAVARRKILKGQMPLLEQFEGK